jgi:hypothetical protein
VQVQFADAETHQILTGVTPGAIADENGTYVDSLRPSGSDGSGSVIQFGAGLERSGTFRLTADRAGYLPFTRAGIVVVRATCGVVPVFVQAELEPVVNATADTR